MTSSSTAEVAVTVAVRGELPDQADLAEPFARSHLTKMTQRSGTDRDAAGSDHEQVGGGIALGDDHRSWLGHQRAAAAGDAFARDL